MIEEETVLNNNDTTTFYCLDEFQKHPWVLHLTYVCIINLYAQLMMDKMYALFSQKVTLTSWKCYTVSSKEMYVEWFNRLNVQKAKTLGIIQSSTGRAEVAQTVLSAHCAAHSRMASSPTNAWKIMLIKRFSCNAGHQEFKRYCTRSKSEESIACSCRSTQERDQPWLWNPWQTSPQRRVMSSNIFFKKSSIGKTQPM